MPGLVDQILAQSGIEWLFFAALTAGFVRGFAGFGTAMIYMPVAAQVLTPFQALTTVILMDVIGPLPNIPAAMRDGHKRDIMRLLTGVMIALPLGLLTLTVIRPELFRFTVSTVTLVLLLLLMLGVRFPGAPKPWMVYGTGLFGGYLAGTTGLAGPPVVMLYMASKHAARVVRANLLIYLFGGDIITLGVMWIMGRLAPEAIVIGLALSAPYLLGNLVGAAVFRGHSHERTYRIVAYVLIAVSAISGLPILD